MSATLAVVAVAVFILLGVYVSWRAGRLDRLHARVDAARTALDLALERRASAAAELASSGLLDPATGLLIAGSVQGTRDAGAERDLAESDLTRALRAAFTQPGFRDSLAGREGADELLARVEAAVHQVFLARKFYNDAVSVTREARQRPLARVFRLAGKAREPRFFEMDDSLVDLRWMLHESISWRFVKCPPSRLVRRLVRGASSAGWPRCSRAASSWTSSPPSRPRSPKTPVPWP